MAAIRRMKSERRMLREEGYIPSQTEVLVLGAGIAGHCAALAAADAGSQVLLLEKSAQPGGSSAIAGGAFAFCGTDEQAALGRADSIVDFRRDLLAAGKGTNKLDLVDAFLEDQFDTYRFLKDRGVHFDLSATQARWHWTGTGRAVSRLHAVARSHPNITFFSKSAAIRLERSPERGRVNGALISFGDQLVDVAASHAVILATGGFSRSKELVRIFAPELAASISHGGVANTGDGFLMASDLGASHADIGHVRGSFNGAIRNYPKAMTGADELPRLIISYLDGAIMVNKNGVRFTNEGQSYKELSSIGMAQPDGVAFQIFDRKVFGKTTEDSSVNNYAEGLISGDVKQSDSIAGIAGHMGLDPGVLINTINTFNANVRAGLDPAFGRTTNLTTIDEAPFYIAATANVLTSTYGGIATSADMAVIDWFGEPIDGLFAAGELVGGFHGAGYYSASALSSSATFGRRAGRNAATYERP
jgi:fumarate reductase flavoprotein subunit